MTESVDRSEWARGPWDDEPDAVVFVHRGVPCRMARNPIMGHWCAYAGVRPGHPLHGVERDRTGLYAHVGITYADCRLPPGVPFPLSGVWWVGFDCGHVNVDLAPLFGELAAFEPAEYRTVEYVRGVLTLLADQLADAGGEQPPECPQVARSRSREG